MAVTDADPDARLSVTDADAVIDADAASMAARKLNARRWSPDAVLARAAATVIGRAGQLPAEVRDAVHRATGEQDDGDDAR